MTSEQEGQRDATDAAERAAKEAAEKGYEKGYKEACEKTEMKGVKEKLESARKMKSKNISDDVIAECLGLSLEQVQAL